DYYFHSLKLKKRKKINWRELHKPQKRTDFVFFASAKQLNHYEFKKYFIFGFSASKSWQIGRINALTAGLEWLVDGAKKEEIKRDENFSGDYQRGGIMFGNEFLLGRFIFSQQIGIYFYKPYKVDDFYYQRYGLVFRITDKFFAGVSLKAHRHVADFLDFRIGVSL
ncbi:MAG: acyloxyacyl hydrolase, partial [Bacteroidetes bacterium]|nr:acyloxyacyl hydrolase [Bacteroidota bacterium]